MLNKSICLKCQHHYFRELMEQYEFSPSETKTVDEIFEDQWTDNVVVCYDVWIDGKYRGSEVVHIDKIPAFCKYNLEQILG